MIFRKFHALNDKIFYITLPLTTSNKCIMEHINRIELQGRVGNIRTNIVGETKVANFSLATDHLYKARDGAAISETTWHNVVAWSNRNMPDLDKICKGTPLHLTGRLRVNRYTAADGTEKMFYEVVANRITRLDEVESDIR